LFSVDKRYRTVAPASMVERMRRRSRAKSAEFSASAAPFYANVWK
jgi:hypothetical protein